MRGGDLSGDAVTIAARLQGLAEPGAVCLSGAAHPFVRALPVAFDDLGPQAVKNVDEPIRAYLARPPSRSLSRALPPVHRRIDAYLARRLHELYVDRLTAITRTVNLSVLDYASLSSLNDAPGLDSRQLAERMNLEPRKAAGLLKRLEAQGLVEAGPGPGGRGARGYRVSPRGLEVWLGIRPAMMAEFDRIMAPLSEMERDTLRTLITRVIQAHGPEGGRSGRGA